MNIRRFIRLSLVMGVGLGLILALLILLSTIPASACAWLPGRFSFAPIVTTTAPIANELNVAHDADISVTFDEPIRYTSLTSRAFVAYGSQSPILAGAYSLDNLSRTATLDPARSFFPGERIEAIVTTATLNITGEQAISPVAWQFTAQVRDGNHGNVYFTPPGRRFGTGSDATRSVAWGDVDNDGDLDLAIGNAGEQNVIHLNDGTGDLSTTVDFGTGSDNTYSLAWGDMNGDGHLDLAVGNYGGQNVVYLNDGSGNLGSTLNFGTGSDNTYSVAWGDANRDGYLDLAVGNNGAQNVVYLNDGVGGFSTAVDFGTGSDAARSVAWGDVDNDEDLDLIVGNYNQQNLIYLNNGSADFSASSSFGTGSDSTTSVAAGDLNGDGYLDLATANYDEATHVCLNDGTGGFGEPSSLGGRWSEAVAIADADGDGDLDIAISGRFYQANKVWLNNGSGVITSYSHSRYFRVAHADRYVIAWGDADNDGDLDLAVGSNGEQNAVAVNRQVNRPPSYAPASVLLEDVDGSITELISAYADGRFGYFSILKEGDVYYLWLNSLYVSGSYRPSRDQRFESQDGLLWYNRTDTNLIREGSPYRHISGLREIITDGSTYEGWEQYYYTWSVGWAQGVRYVTSASGINWTVVNEPALIGTARPSVMKSNGVYQMWASPRGDPNVGFRGSMSLRYRTSSSGGSGWGHWQTGGTLVIVDGEEVMSPSRVRRLVDGTCQLFYLHGSHVNVATSATGISFTTQITALLDYYDVLPDATSIVDFAIVNIDTEDWFYFTYRNQDGDYRIAASRPTVDVQITKHIISTASVLPSDAITYTLTYINAGLGTARGVLITDVIPVSVTNVSYASSGATITATEGITYALTVQDLASGEGGIITITGEIGLGLPASVFTNTAIIATTRVDADIGNNSDSTGMMVDNAVPLALDDVYSTDEDTPLAVTAPGVLGNDVDLNNDSLTVVLDGEPSNGTLVLGLDGSFTYTPTLDFNGVDTYTYRTTDAQALSNLTTVTISVNAVNDPPVAVDDTVATDMNTPMTVKVLVNDSDVDGDSLNVSVVDPAIYGTTAISGAAMVVYTPTQDFVGIDTFVYTVSDGSLTDTATVTVTVNPGSESPQDCVYLSVVFKNYRKYAPAPDLVVDSLVATSNSVQVTIKNQGNAPVASRFWVDVYIDPDPVPTAVNQIWYDGRCSQGLVWGIAVPALPLEPDETLTLTIGDAYYSESYSDFIGLLPAGTPVYAQVDSVDLNTTYGGVLESHEIQGVAYNNIKGPVFSTLK